MYDYMLIPYELVNRNPKIKTIFENYERSVLDYVNEQFSDIKLRECGTDIVSRMKRRRIVSAYNEPFRDEARLKYGHDAAKKIYNIWIKICSQYAPTYCWPRKLWGYQYDILSSLLNEIRRQHKTKDGYSAAVEIPDSLAKAFTTQFWYIEPEYFVQLKLFRTLGQIQMCADKLASSGGTHWETTLMKFYDLGALPHNHIEHIRNYFVKDVNYYDRSTLARCYGSRPRKFLEGIRKFPNIWREMAILFDNHIKEYNKWEFKYYRNDHTYCRDFKGAALSDGRLPKPYWSLGWHLKY